MNIAKAPHPIYFLSTVDDLFHTHLIAIKEEWTSERFTCVFVSGQDAEEFAVANDLTFDLCKISEAKDQISIHNRCAVAVRDGLYRAVVNPPPLICGVWRILSVESLRTWSWKAKEPLLEWAHYEVRFRK